MSNTSQEEENKISPLPKGLRQIIFHPNLNTTDKIGYMGKNMLFIFTYTLVISISLAISHIISILLANKSKKAQLGYSILNLFILIIITIIVCWFSNAEVQL